MNRQGVSLGLNHLHVMSLKRKMEVMSPDCLIRENTVQNFILQAINDIKVDWSSASITKLQS